MQLELKSIRICGDDDLLKHRTQNPLACRDRRIGVIPQLRQIRPQGKYLCTLRLSYWRRLTCTGSTYLILKPSDLFKSLVPEPFEIASGKTIIWICCIISSMWQPRNVPVRVLTPSA